MTRKFNVSKSLEIIFVNGMPQMKIPCIDIWAEDKVREHNYYLSPFRGYRFQISGDENGSGDYASTPVIGLGNIILAYNNYKVPHSASSIFASNSSSIAYGIFEAFITATIDKFESRCDNTFSFKNMYDIIPRFTEECIKYIEEKVLSELDTPFTRKVTDPELIEQLNKQFG